MKIKKKLLIYIFLISIFSSASNSYPNENNPKDELIFKHCVNGLYGSSALSFPCHPVEIILKWHINIKMDEQYINYILYERYPGYILIMFYHETYSIQSADTKYYPGKIIQASGKIRQDWFNVHVKDLIGINEKDLRARISAKGLIGGWELDFENAMTENTVHRPSFIIYANLTSTAHIDGILTVIQPSVVELNNLKGRFNHHLDYFSGSEFYKDKLKLLRLIAHPIFLENQLFTYKEIQKVIHRKTSLTKSIELNQEEDMFGYVDEDISGYLEVKISIQKNVLDK